MHDYSALLGEIEIEIQSSLTEGQVASYIPELGAVPLGGFAMALVDAQGQLHQCGTAQTPFSIQSISKLFTLTLVLKELGPALWDKVGREPSGSAFNSLLHLEYEDGRPRNPFINTGALVVTDLLLSLFPDAQETVLSCVRRLSGNPKVDINPAVARSEQAVALGTAMAAAVVAGVHNSVPEAQAAMGGGFETEYQPDPDMASTYARLYEDYKRFGRFVEEESGR